mmetsp:Transcript_32733/g.54820  ORF Transcript_32733/g.54820 Transcript_32733/m.54820 type:complete len:305 (+) Transcript_32733:149-1063(+)
MRENNVRVTPALRLHTPAPGIRRAAPQLAPKAVSAPAHRVLPRHASAHSTSHAVARCTQTRHRSADALLRPRGLLRPCATNLRDEIAPLKLVVLDWDGTVVDSIAHVVDSWIKAIEAFRPEGVPSEEQVRRCIGMSVDLTIHQHCPGVSPEEHAAIRAAYGDLFRSGKHQIRMFEGAREGITRVESAGFLLAVATGKGRRGLDEELATHQLDRFFAASRTADVTESKPHPQMLLELLAETGALAERTIMVGDSVLDMQLAINAGTACVGVGFGAEPEHELLRNGAPFCASSWPELVTYIEETLC